MLLSLKILRLKAGFLTQQEVVKEARRLALPISLSNLSNLERGDFTWMPREGTVEGLAKLYKIPVKDLMIIFQNYLNGRNNT